MLATNISVILMYIIIMSSLVTSIEFIVEQNIEIILFTTTEEFRIEELMLNT